MTALLGGLQVAMQYNSDIF